MGEMAMKRGAWGYAWFGRLLAGRTNDAEARSLLVERLRDDERTRREAIRVSVSDAVVTLSGEVTSSAALLAADDDAWSTPGVRDVNNHLRVGLRAAGTDGPRAA
jgi:osmotically-inducible protein OsmY